MSSYSEKSRKIRGKRSAENLAPVNLQYILGLIEKVDKQNYCFSLQKGLTGEEQKMRNKALISLLYLSGRRISELVGRTLKDEEGNVVDVYEGVKLKDFRIRKVKNRRVLVMRFRVLKKGRIKTWKEKGRFPKKVAEIELSFHDKPFINYVLGWLRHLQNKGASSETKVFNLSRFRAYQILRELDRDVWLHWLRHQRLSHLAEFLSPYELARKVGFWSSLEPALSYVRKVRQEWS